MSNIPNSAMPHAWAHDDEQDQQEEREGMSFGTLAVAGGIGALLLYFLFRK